MSVGSFSAVCLKMPQDKTSHTNKMSLNYTGTECLHKDPEISTLPNHQMDCPAGDRVTRREKVFSAATNVSSQADCKAAQCHVH